MAPSRARAHVEDNRSEASSTKERNTHNTHGHTTNPHHKGRKPNSSHNPAIAVIKELQGRTSGPTPLTSANGHGPGPDTVQSPSIPWASLPTTVLHNYRHAYHLPLPCAFSSTMNARLLTLPGVGRSSPTMAVRKQRRRVPKEELAKMVRKHFNGMSANETEALSRIIYIARAERETKDGCRMQFAPWEKGSYGNGRV
ncbi:MAG: hypothetical protein M1834_003927 [Cirrosporium novae-zelandiae]|nr:MAG: hypothetical protein M1834_003927 [Cirrosporium novae-zelandiae]